MSTVVVWCAFFGAWLLVAGPIYQAAIELRDEDIERDEISRVAQAVQPPTTVSPWWWLLPPVHFWLQRRAANEHRNAVLGELTSAQVEGLISYIEKATAWMFVGLGGFLIAVNETWSLREHEGWPPAVFWALIVVMTLLCAGNASLRMGHSRRTLGEQSR